MASIGHGHAVVITAALMLTATGGSAGGAVELATPGGTGAVDTAAVGRQAPGTALPTHEIRSTPVADLGASKPSGLTWNQSGQALVVLTVRAGGTDAVEVGPQQERVGSYRLNAVQDPGTVAVDGSGRTTAVVGGTVVEWTSQGMRPTSSGSLALSQPLGATYDSADALVVLDGDQLVRLSGQGDVTRTPVPAAAGADLRGLSAAPGSDLLYTFDTSSNELLGLTSSGDVGARYDIAGSSVRNVQGVAVAPSSDSTDETSVQSLYVADAGSPSSEGAIVEFALTAATATATAAAVTGSVVRTVQTSAFNPPSPDPSGVAFSPSADRLMIADGEVDEMTIFQNANLFLTTRAGVLQTTGVSQPWSNEPVGVGYDTLHGRLFVCDDDKDRVFELIAGSDGRYGTSDDTVTNFSTASSGNTDPEGVEHDPVNDSVWTVDGVNREVYQVRRGSDGRYGTADDPRTQFDVAGYGAVDPEGIGYDGVRGTLVVVDGKSETIYELDRSGTLLNSINIAGLGLRTAAGVTVAPGSQNSSDRNYYVVTRGVDNNSDPNENDGKLFEIRATLPPQGGGGNQAPTVDAGPDSSVVMPASASLDGTVSDDGLPNPPGAVTTTWSKISGPGTVTFGAATNVDTTASFSMEGTYVLRLTAGDSALTSFDEVTVVAAPVGSAVTTEMRVSAGSDDAEQTLSGSLSLASSDLELTTDGANQQVVGLRFAGVQVPAGATVTSAWVQFRSDEVSTTAAASLTIKAEASDNAATYSSASNVTSRSTTGSVAWSPPQWTAANQAGAAQRTPELASLVQAVVGRSGWVQGNAVALQVSGTGTRTADSFEGGASFAPLLHIEYTTS